MSMTASRHSSVRAMMYISIGYYRGVTLLRYMEACMVSLTVKRYHPVLMASENDERVA